MTGTFTDTQNDIDKRLFRATCRVIVAGKLIATAWILDKDKGYLVTASHIFSDNGVDIHDKIFIQFQDDEKEIEVDIVYPIEIRQDNLDFAILQAKNSFPVGRIGLPISLNRSLTLNSLCQTYGFGESSNLKESAPSNYIGSFPDGSDSDSSTYFHFRSDYFEHGYSGAAIYSQELNAVVGIVSWKPSGIDRPMGRENTISALPIYRIASSWPDMRNYIRQRDLEGVNAESIKLLKDDILVILAENHTNHYPHDIHPTMSSNEILQKLKEIHRFSDDKVDTWEYGLSCALRDLETREFINMDVSTSTSLISLATNGLVANNIRAVKLVYKNHDRVVDEFTEREYENRIRRVYTIEEIKKCALDRNDPRNIFISGSSQTGKSYALTHNFTHAFEEDALIIIFSLGSDILKKSTLDFLGHWLTNVIIAQANVLYRKKIKGRLAKEKTEDQIVLKEETLFSTIEQVWQRIREETPLKTVFVLDQAEEMCNIGENDTSTIVEYIGRFINNPKNGKFILVGRDSLVTAKNPVLNSFLENSTHISWEAYPQETTNHIINRLRYTYNVDPGLEEYLRVICDSHPFVLHNYIEILKDILTSTLSVNLTIDQIENATYEFISQNIKELSRIYQSLSKDEQELLLYLSRHKDENPFITITKNKYNMDEILEEARGDEKVGFRPRNQSYSDHFLTSSINGVNLLQLRGWLEKLDGNIIRFNFGLMLIYLRQSSENGKEASYGN